MAFKNLADFKRRIKPGVKLEITNHLQPQMSRTTTVLTVASKHFSTELPADHPNKAAYPDGSFNYWPDAKNFDAATGTTFMAQRVGNTFSSAKAVTYNILEDGQTVEETAKGA